MEALNKLTPQIEALIFGSPKPLCVSEIEGLLANEEINVKQIKASLEELKKRYSGPEFGFFLQVSSNKEYQFRTKKEFSSLLERLFASRSRTLSRAAQETLAIIAYRQPVTRV